MSRNKQTLKQLVKNQALEDHNKRMETLEATDRLSAHFKIKADSFPESDKDNLRQQINKDYKDKIQRIELFFPGRNRLRMLLKFKHPRKLKNIVASKPEYKYAIYTLIQKYRVSIELLEPKNFDKEIEDQK